VSFLFEVKESGTMDDRLDAIKEQIRILDPELPEDDPGFQIAVVLLAAWLVTGPDIDGLFAFTGYSREMVSDISKRMHEARLWESGRVKTDHWFDGDRWTVGMWIDTLVAEGLLIPRQREDGETEYRPRKLQ
jgi:hypothetical protein